MLLELAGTVMGLPSRVGFALPYTIGSKQSFQRPLSFSYCPAMNPSFLHSLMMCTHCGVCFAMVCASEPLDPLDGVDELIVPLAV